ncbi:MAG: hypothetical protein U0531_08660 [Dehalococcoidia bacterium]
MRNFLPVAAALALVVAFLAVSSRSGSKTSVPTAKTAPIVTPDTRLIVADPKELPLPAGSMIPGRFTTTEGASASAQWNRVWNREESDPAGAQGVNRVTINVRLYLSTSDAIGDFTQTNVFPAVLPLIDSTLAARGVPKEYIISTDPIEVESLGAGQQSVMRVEYTLGSPSEVYVQYWVAFQVRNTKATITTFGQKKAGEEPANLRDETVQIAKRQAARLLAMPLADASR